MSVPKEKDPDEAFLEEHFPGNRVQNWLWHFLTKNYPGMKFHAPGPMARKEMGAYLKNEPVALQRAHHNFNEGFVPDLNFLWIKGGRLQDHFLMEYLVKNCETTAPEIHGSLSGRRWVEAFIDCLPKGLAWKINFIKGAGLAWTNHVTQHRLLGWFKEGEEAKKCYFAWEWLEKKKPLLIWNSAPFQSYEDLLMAIGNKQFEPYEKEVLVSAIKRAWAQHQYRQKLKGKRQFNFMLTEESIKLLDKLAKRQGCSKAKVIEDLIKGASGREKHPADLQDGG